MLTVESLTKRYGSEAVPAVEGIDLAVEPGELFTLLGPSGCGKTTTLRSIAGLEQPDDGRILLDGDVIFDAGARLSVPASQRGFGMVFQSYAIWPHMTVFQNVSFPLEVLPRRHRPRKSVIRERVERVLDVTELATFAGRPATKLSGGQQQRLALARALVTEPPLLLLDEPLSNLDAKLRESMRFELRRLQRELGLTTVYVTHDQTEALAMSSRIAVLNDGRVEQVGTPREIYGKPASRFVAEFIGTSNFMAGVLGPRRAGLARIDVGSFAIWSAGSGASETGSTTLAIRPESVSVTAGRANSAAEAPNSWTGMLVGQAFLGDSVDYVVAIGDVELRARGHPSQSLAVGAPVHVTVEPGAVLVVPSR